MSSMTVDTLVTIGVFLLTQMISLLWFLGSVRTNTAVTNQRLDGVQREIERLNTVIDGVSRLDMRLVLVEERQLAQGKRIDDVNNQMHDFGRRLTRVIEVQAGRKKEGSE